LPVVEAADALAFAPGEIPQSTRLRFVVAPAAASLLLTFDAALAM
jgi:hypothetical protein